MIDRETVMGWLELLAQDNWREWYSDSDVQATARAALALLRKNEAVEPNHNVNGTTCGNCGDLICWFDRYCSTCGKKVKWNDDDPGSNLVS